MAIYMPPLCRKKKVLERYNPDTFRVISHFAEESHLKTEFVEINQPSDWRSEWLKNNGLSLPDIYNRKTEVLPQAVPDFRAHRPHPLSCGFLRHNVHLLNEPVCNVYTASTKEQQQNWWPSKVSEEKLTIPAKTKDTVYRSDYLQIERQQNEPFGATRHTANPNVEPAYGTVPIHFLKPKNGSYRTFKERVSYEHQYNSRIDPNYPIRGKRQGSFVWEPQPHKNIKKYNVITAEEGVCRQEQMEAKLLQVPMSEPSELQTNSLIQMEPHIIMQKSDSSDNEPFELQDMSASLHKQDSPKIDLGQTIIPNEQNICEKDRN